MKAYSIGREHGCDIVINDTTDVISRRHAVLNVLPSGKMTIIDQSHNGTYVNGIRIASNVPVPVTRKDNISFAHIARLDWDMVPKTTSPLQYLLYAVAVIVVIGACVFGYSQCGDSTSNDQNNDRGTLVQDSLKQVEKKDSIEQVKKDSVDKAKKDSVDKAKSTHVKKVVKKQNPEGSKTGKGGQKTNKSKEETKKQETKKFR